MVANFLTFDHVLGSGVKEMRLKKCDFCRELKCLQVQIHKSHQCLLHIYLYMIQDSCTAFYILMDFYFFLLVSAIYINLNTSDLYSII